MNSSAVSRGANQRLHVIQIALERATALGRQRVARLGYATFEALVARYVVRLFQLARVHTEIAVRGLHESLEVVEAQRVVHRERAHDAKPETLVNQAIQPEGTLVRGFASHRAQR